MCYRKDLIAGSVVKNPPANAGDTGDPVLIPRSGRSPGGGNPLQYSCLENPMDRGAWKNQTRLGDWTHTGTLIKPNSVKDRRGRQIWDVMMR